MNARALLAAWAPDGARWSRWCKPVLFSFLADEPDGIARAPVEPELDLARLFAAAATTETEPAPHPYRGGPTPARHAIVVDLPGATSIGWGVALARAGFRPVPLFNAMPGPIGKMPAPLQYLTISLVNVHPTMDTLAGAAPLLATIDVHPEAPPAFLLDAARNRTDGRVVAGRYDNRALSLPSDFPSGAALAQAGLRHVVVVHAGYGVAWDLVDTLAGWRRAGLDISSFDLDDSTARPWRRPLWRPLVTLVRHAAIARFYGGHGAGPFGDHVPPGVG